MMHSIIIHDSAAAQATFIEISFGLNAAFAGYESFRDYIGKHADKWLASHASPIQAKEADKPEHAARLRKLNEYINTLVKCHAIFQRRTCKFARVVSFLMCVLCLVVLYFDLLELSHFLLATLISPLPLYVAFSVIVYFWYWRKVVKTSKEYSGFVTKFEGSPLENIQKALETLRDDKLP